MKQAPLLPLLCFSIALLTAGPAFAIKEFKAEFDKRYNLANPTTKFEKQLAAKVNVTKCNVCHLGMTKKKRNTYGKALEKYLDRKADKLNPDKIQEALKNVEAEYTIEGEDKSPTFGDLIRQGDLPGDAK